MKEDCQYVMDAAWKYMSNLKEPYKFMHNAEIWVGFTVVHFSVRNNQLFFHFIFKYCYCCYIQIYNNNYFQLKEINTLLGEIISQLNHNREFENYYPQLQSIVEKVVAHTQDFESLLTMVSVFLFHNKTI